MHFLSIFYKLYDVDWKLMWQKFKWTLKSKKILFKFIFYKRNILKTNKWKKKLEKEKIWSWKKSNR